ncbi:twin-arginine translocase TatA/TatE family subunit [Nocardioides sp. KIGAM211]|uniref:Sec-independent protein translocase protein TatA n=1 Tax=Nocardioides luti TaxID=2761101 RepID=A0A7X0REI6_9ACTN|nr:twin-arginine translocase TatA/TatE family subunit [Nocardioides luti]
MGGLGTTELLLILAVVVLLFGASKLPELARGSGRALRIFKAETKGLVDGDDDDTKTAEEKELEARQKLLDAERDRIERERITRERRDDTTA